MGNRVFIPQKHYWLTTYSPHSSLKLASTSPTVILMEPFFHVLFSFCPHFCISSKLTSMNKKEQYHRKPWGRCNWYFLRCISTETQRRKTMVEHFGGKHNGLPPVSVFVFCRKVTLTTSSPQSPCLFFWLLLSQTFDSRLPLGGCFG